MAEIKNHSELAIRETYANKHLPVPLADEVIKKAAEFVDFLVSRKATTHPAIRVMVSNIETAVASLQAEILADKLVGTEDEMDAWERNGWGKK